MTDFRKILQKYNLPLRYVLVVTTIASSYIFTITFVQLGLPNFGRITLGLDKDFVNKSIMLFGIAGAFSAFIGGLVLGKVRNRIDWIILIRALSILAAIGGRSLAPRVISASAYLNWLLFMGVILGFSSAFGYSLAYLLLPPKNRGMVGGVITAIIYGIAAMSLPTSWTLSAFLHDSLVPALVAYLSYLMLLIFVLGKPVSQQEVDDNVGEKPYRNYGTKKIFFVLTLVLFIDSFGFIRVVMGTEDFANLTWHGSFPMLVYIGVVHILSALFFGWMYDRKNPVFVIKASLIFFFIADLLFALLYGVPEYQHFLAYSFVFFYAPAVSIYTIVYLMLIADVVTKETMGKTYGLYTAIVGWLASFISTGVALSMLEVLSPNMHLLIAGLLSLIAFFILRSTFKRTEQREG